MKKFAFVFTAAAVLVAAPLSAQWTAFTPNNDGAEFWDNVSADGATCNSGYILTQASGTCSSQRPANWLPYTGPVQNEFWGGAGSAPTLMFGGGTFDFTLISGSNTLLGGDVAGQNRDWGYYDVATTTFVNLNTTTMPLNNVAITGNWGLWVSMTNGTTALSPSSSQFALFRNTQNPSLWTVGIEDIYTGQGGGSDRDFNDMFFSFSPTDPDDTTEIVPEPATMTMLATGLVGMAAARRRRKNNG